MQHFCVYALAGCNPPIWPQSRWLGAEEAIQWVGLLQAVYGLLGVAFCEWANIKPRAATLNPLDLVAPMLLDQADRDGLSAARDLEAPAEVEGNGGDGCFGA